ncbi:MAG: D-alanine--D-alanine ligase [bacterium]|nr:D-alanine--D-alanine ligase [bacterium]
MTPDNCRSFGRIGVLAGGPSSEREISLRSGKAVHKALIEEGCQAIFLDIRDDIRDLIRAKRLDVAFIALHGRFGEDGTVQGILEEARIPYTGSGPAASRAALDKIASKDIFIASGIPTPRHTVFERGQDNLAEGREVRFPIVVKPQFEGSSIGLSIVKDKSQLEDAFGKAFKYGEKALLEEHIDGRELTVGILDDKPLPVIEIVTRENVYDYTAKYNDPYTKYVVPAPIEKDIYERAQELGRRAHTALGCRSFSRVDMIMGEDGGIFVLEVNTIPGMTERSLLPKAAGVAGLSFNRLCMRMVEGVRR